jgi:hypothetical protein
MRQVDVHAATAVVALLACCGIHVPADSAELGPLDAIYTRIGAADDLAGGRSTFMVEMTEAAYILNRATPQGLVLIDESAAARRRSTDWRWPGQSPPIGGAQSLPLVVRDALFRTHGAGASWKVAPTLLRRGRAQDGIELERGRGPAADYDLRVPSGSPFCRRNHRPLSRPISRALTSSPHATRRRTISSGALRRQDQSHFLPLTRAPPMCWRDCWPSNPTRCRRGRRWTPSMR